ncbi:hypothetical protein, partial [Chryseobacterium sp.]|uniref:hypothetical protein n=1 Tax=Chryseobacterium sp. TaxID=1871047 RepID=UPI0025C14D93
FPFRTQKLSPPAPMVLLTRESRPPPVFILFLKILYLYDKGFFFALYLPYETIYDLNGLKPVPIDGSVVIRLHSSFLVLGSWFFSHI